MTAMLLPCTSMMCGLDPDTTCTMYFRYSLSVFSGCYHTRHPFESKHLCK